MRTNLAGISTIKQNEGLRLEAYKCPAGVWTIGYGHTKGVKPGQTITAHQADAILDVDLDNFERAVFELTGGVLNQNQFSACVSFTFNVGVTAFSKSTLLKKIQQGDFKSAADEFNKWVNVNGEKMPGLVRRRAAERALFQEMVN